MKARIIHTKFYESERVLNLSASSRWLYMYYLTCTGIGLTGAFKWSNSKTTFETALSTKDLEKAKNELTQARLVFFFDNWIVIPETSTKTGYKDGSEITAKAYSKEFSLLPDEVKSMLDTPCKESATPAKEMVGSIHTPINKKSEIRSKDESVREGDELNQEFFKETALEFNISASVVQKKCLAFEDYCASKGKRYKSKRATVRGWIRNDLRDRKIIPNLMAVDTPYNLPKPEDVVSPEKIALIRSQAYKKIGGL